jgi:hypothetical protein
MTWQPCVVMHMWQSRDEPTLRFEVENGIQEGLVVSERMRNMAAHVRRLIRWWRRFSSDLRGHFRTEQFSLFTGMRNWRTSDIPQRDEFDKKDSAERSTYLPRGDVCRFRWTIATKARMETMSGIWSAAFDHVCHKRDVAIKPFRPMFVN